MKSALAREMDQLQARIDPLLRRERFRKKGRVYNRSTHDGLTQVVSFQMGPFEPPGTAPIPGLRENLYGKFTVNLGVYVPEVAGILNGCEAKSVVHEYECCIRTRLGRSDKKEIWWKISATEPVVADVSELLMNDAFPLFQGFESRDQILNEFLACTDNTPLMFVPRIVCAIILFNRGEREQARSLLAAQARDHTWNPGHAAKVVELARRLGIDISN